MKKRLHFAMPKTPLRQLKPAKDETSPSGPTSHVNNVEIMNRLIHQERENRHFDHHSETQPLLGGDYEHLEEQERKKEEERRRRLQETAREVSQALGEGEVEQEQEVQECGEGMEDRTDNGDAKHTTKEQ